MSSLWSSSASPSPLSPKATGHGSGASIVLLLSLQFLLLVLSQASDDSDFEVSRTQDLCGIDRGFSLQLRGSDHGVVFSDFGPDGDFASHSVAMARFLDEDIPLVFFLARGFGSVDAATGYGPIASVASSHFLWLPGP